MNRAFIYVTKLFELCQINLEKSWNSQSFIEMASYNEEAIAQEQKVLVIHLYIEFALSTVF